SISTFYLRLVSAHFSGGYIALTRQFIENLPIPDVSDLANELVATLAKCLIVLRAESSVRTATQKFPRDPQLVVWFERWVNALVYELFFPEELHARGLNFFS